MKKVFITLLVLLLTVSMFGCKKKTTADLVNAAIKKTAALDSYEFNGSLYNTMEIMGFKSMEGTEYSYKAKNVKQSAEYLGNIGIYDGVNGQSMKIYSNKDAIYIDTGAYKIFVKHGTDLGDAFEISTLVEWFLKELPERALNEATVSENNQGNKVYTVLLNDDELAKTYKEYFDVQSDEDMELKATGSAFKVEITIDKNGYVVYYVATFHCNYEDISATDENADASYEVETEVILDFIEPGSTVTFDAPDPSEYIDYEKVVG